MSIFVSLCRIVPYIRVHKMVFISKQELYLSGIRLVLKKGFVTKVVTVGSCFLSYRYRN